MPVPNDDSYDHAVVASVPFSWRRGCRGHPDVPRAFPLLARAAQDAAGALTDASGCLGLPARAALRADATILEPSAVAIDAIRRDLSGRGAEPPDRTGALRLIPGLPWDLEPGAHDRIVLFPAAERGNARVRAEIAAAATGLRPDGELIVLLDKRLGAKRYERDVARLFARGGVVARDGGLRLSRWRAPHAPAAPSDPWIRFEVGGRPTVALAGCYAAGKLDPGTATLLRSLADDAAIGPNTTVLDVGCGWGPIARFAARAGASVVAVDDDLAAVRSCVANVPEATVEHADASRPAGDGRRFDRVLVNPPFHVGRAVRNDLPQAMLRTGRARLAETGELWWVENRELRHDRAEGLRDAQQVADEDGFRVMRVRGRTGR